MSRIVTRLARRGAQGQVRHVSTVSYGAAEGLVAGVYAQLERDFGMLAPPVSLHAPAPEALAACWLMLRETLVAAGAAPRSVKEVVAAAVSHANACPYCVEVHGTALRGLVRGRDSVAVIEGRLDAINDPRLRAIAAWAAGTARPDAEPFPYAYAAELIGVAVTFHYLNRMVNVFLSESPLPPGTPAVLRGGVRRLVGRRTRARRGRPGEALELLPAASLPADLSWAAGSPSVAGAFARAAAAVEVIGEQVVPAPVRDLVTAGAGEERGHGRGWPEDAVADLPAGDRPAGRLALLTVHASYRVGRTVIEDFRRDRPDEAALIGLTSWASLVAARAAGGRLHAELKRIRTRSGDRRER